MAPSPRRAEISVGLFLLLGIALTGGLILRFTHPRLASTGGYPIIVEVRDATGIRAGVPVRLGGIDIGRVSGDPALNEDFVLLSIPLEIRPEARIPTGSTVKVGTSGLMGDSYVRILPPEQPTGEFLPEGHRIVAQPSGNLADLATEAGEALDGMTDASVEIRSAARQVERLAARAEAELLTDRNLSNLATLLEDLKTTSTNLRAVSADAAPLLAETRSAIADIGAAATAATTTFAGVDQGVKELTTTLATVPPVLQEFDTTLDDLRKTLAKTTTLLDQIEKGDGLASALLNDTSLKRDFEGFLDKLNRSGILFYPREGGSEKPILPGLRRQP